MLGEKPVIVPRGGFAVKLKLRGPSLARAKAREGALAMPQKCPEILQSIYERHLVEFFFFHVLLTVHLSIFILVINQLDAQNLFIISLFHASTCFEQHVLIVRRSKLYYTASGITYRCDDTRGCIIQF